MSEYKGAGDSNRITRKYFDSLLLEMRHIDAVKPSTKLDLYGQTFDTPIMSAALSHLDKYSPNGTVEMSKGLLGANGVMWIGMGDEAELEAIIATGVKTIKIIKPNIDNEVIFKKIKHAQDHGALAIGMDLDHSFNSKGAYDNVLGQQMAPKSFEEIKAFVEASELPFIIKGVLSEVDALKCIEAGVQGIVVSHHHGIMDYAVPPLKILPKIVKAVDKRIPVFVDCGVNSGYDTFKALALGADAVCAGRILMDHVKADQAQGVTNKLKSMTEELAGVMARTCSKDIKSIDPGVIWRE